MAAILAISGGAWSSAAAGGDFPAKEKLPTRGGHHIGRAPPLSLLILRGRKLIGVPASRSLLSFIGALGVLHLICHCSSLHHSSSSPPPFPSSSSSSRGGYAVLINTWKRNSLLKKSVAHYASCGQTDAIHVVWSEIDPPSDSFRSSLEQIALDMSQRTQGPFIRFELNEHDNLNNRFKPIDDLESDAIFSVDDDVIVPCPALDFAFSVWQSAPETMVGFVPRAHLIDESKGEAYYKYGGWWSVWWMGTYSMVLTKAAFFHRKYLDLYTKEMPSAIHDYVSRERNCEDIAMSLLVANITQIPPIWVQSAIYEIGLSGISSLKGHNNKRSRCLNDFVPYFGGAMPLVSTTMKAVDSRKEWLW